MVCRGDWIDDGLRAQTVLCQSRIRRATKPSPRFALRAAFPQPRALWRRIHRLCGETHSASTILRATECSQCGDAIAPGLARPITKDDWSQRAFAESRAPRLSWLARLHRLSRTPS